MCDNEKTNPALRQEALRPETTPRRELSKEEKEKLQEKLKSLMDDDPSIYPLY